MQILGKLLSLILFSAFWTLAPPHVGPSPSSHPKPSPLQQPMHTGPAVLFLQGPPFHMISPLLEGLGQEQVS